MSTCIDCGAEEHVNHTWEECIRNLRTVLEAATEFRFKNGSYIFHAVRYVDDRWYVSDYLRINVNPPDANMTRNEAITKAKLLALNCGKHSAPVSHKEK